MAEFRYNKLSHHWVLFAPNRAKRPTNFHKQDHFGKNIQSCPFEIGNEGKTPKELLRIGDEKSWRCRIIPNLYNALSIEVDPIAFKSGSFENRTGFGAHEIIIETPNHHKQMTHFSLDEFFDYFTIIKLRVEDLKKDTRLKYFSIFKNYGENGGATLEHSHSQLIATPFMPKNIQQDLKSYQQYKSETDRDFFDDIIADEKEFKKGQLFENHSFVAFCPYASRFPFEISIIATKKLCDITKFQDVDIYALSEVIGYCFSKLSKVLGDFDFNMVVKNGDIQSSTNPNRFHIEIMPRLYKIAGFELDTEIMINTFLPENATKILKES